MNRERAVWMSASLRRSKYRLAGLVVKASTPGTEDPGFESRLRRDFSGSSHTSDFKIGIPVDTLPGAWYYRVSAGTGWPGVSILWLGEMESLVSKVYLSVAAHNIVWADPYLRYTSMLLGHEATNQQTSKATVQTPESVQLLFCSRGSGWLRDWRIDWSFDRQAIDFFLPTSNP